MAFQPSSKVSANLPRWPISILIAALLAPPANAGWNPFRSSDSSAPKAKARVKGYGLLENLDLEKTLRFLVVGEKAPEFFSANFIEDAALILRAKVIADGYLNAKISASLTVEDGSSESYQWSEVETPILPRRLNVRMARFEIQKGLLFYYQDLHFAGLESLTEEIARSLFIETGGLLPLKRSRGYTPDRLESGIKNLIEILKREGYEDASATVHRLLRDDRSGKVSAVIHVVEGKRSIVRSVRIEGAERESDKPSEPQIVSPGVPYSSLWLQDFSQELRQQHYRNGFPDTAVEIIPAQREDTGESIQIDLTSTVVTGPQIKVGSVTFGGQDKSKPSVLRERVSQVEGDWLDRISVEQSRHRLARLGIFDLVDVTYEERDPQTRDIHFQVKEGKTIDTSLLFGYGSYELLRAGLELEQFNVLGRAHHARLRAVQSFKSSSADYTYTMPELLGKDIDVFLNASILSRKEISFTRQEFGGGAGARRYFPSIGSDVSTRYNYEILTAADNDLVLEETARKAGVASLITDIRHDRRDNPLTPRTGYKLFANMEVAAKYLGSEVNYERFELNTSYHKPIGRSRWVHMGLSHGFLFTLSGEAQDLPFNRRFFPGGENSMRGFQQGEAAPRDAEGRVVGAETYLGGNLEIEQGLTPQWSMVGFVDVLGFAKSIEDYPFDETRIAVGAGVRWNTFIGPVRLEYGRNLNPGAYDPSGTIHFSIGFPF